MNPFRPVIHKYTTPRYLTVNVYLVETEHGVVVVDGATALSTSREIRALADEHIRKPILAVLLTHGHPDHYVGVGEIVKGLDVPILATQGAIDFAHYQDREKFDTLIRRNYGEDTPPQRVFPNHAVHDGESCTFDGLDFKIEDLGPCESGADAIWSTSIEGIRHAFVGDIVYNHMHSYFRDGHAFNWLNALDRLLGDYDHSVVLHPGHGEDCGREMLHWEKAYIQAFLGTLRSLAGGDETLSADEKQALVATMQSFLPNDRLINLLKFEMDETIRLLSRALREEPYVLPL